MLLKNLSKCSLCFLILLQLGGCSSTTMDDFFGIQMDPSLSELFIIATYDDMVGAQYYSSKEMNKDVYAYAEFIKDKVEFKIVNDSQNPLPMSYVTDEFKIITQKGQAILLKKSDDFTKYPTQSNINPGESVVVLLEIPTTLWEKFDDVSGVHGKNANYFDAWHNWESSEIMKKGTKEIHICLARKTDIILKPIPQ